MHKLSENVERKFTDVIDLADWSIMTDTGWQPVEDVKQTVDYQVWHLDLANGQFLDCADNHIVFLSDYTEIFVKDLNSGDLIITKSGPIAVNKVYARDISEPMYDIGVASDDHRYYSNDILSHNTTTAAGYLLWYSMFVDDSTILIAAHKYTGAQEIMSRIRYAYETCPDFIRGGVTSYNKQSIEFENGSRIIAQTTTETTGRGLSVSLLYADELSFVEPNIAREFWTSISPTLATGGKALITSTPNSDEDQFADIWKEANKRFDEYGEEQELGRNGFFPYLVTWDQHPDRDEKWKASEISRIGTEKFLREHDCLSANSLITIQDNTGKIFTITIGDFYSLIDHTTK